MNSVWVCQQQSQTSHLRPDSVIMSLKARAASAFPGVCSWSPHHTSVSSTQLCIIHMHFMLGAGLELPLHKDSCTFPMVDSAAVKHPLSLAVTEPREATAHTDPSGKDKAIGSSNCLKHFSSEILMWM